MSDHEIKVKKGIYQHFKKKYYEVIDVARHSETLEYMVVYRMLEGDFSLWLRPVSMFLEQIEHDGKQVPRFKFITCQNAKDFLGRTDI